MHNWVCSLRISSLALKIRIDLGSSQHAHTSSNLLRDLAEHSGIGVIGVACDCWPAFVTTTTHAHTDWNLTQKRYANLLC